MCWFVDWICIMALLLTEDVMNNPWRAKVAKKAKWFPAFLFLCPFVFVLSFCLSVCLVLLSPFCSRLCLVLLIEERNPAFGNSNVTISIAAEFLIWLDVIKEKKKKKKKEKKKETITKNWNSVLKWIFETANQIASKDRQPIKRGKRRPRSEIVASTDRLLSAGINLIRLVGRLVNLSHSGLVIGFWSDSLVRNPDGSFFKPISHLHFRLIISFLGAHFEFHPWIHRINPLARSHWRESTTCLQFTTLIYNFILICACVCVCVCVRFVWTISKWESCTPSTSSIPSIPSIPSILLLSCCCFGSIEHRSERGQCDDSDASASLWIEASLRISIPECLLCARAKIPNKWM